MAFIVNMIFQIEGDVSLHEADEAVDTAMSDLYFTSKPKCDVKVHRTESRGGDVFAEVTLIRRETSATTSYPADDPF